jgi:hypothetical protein
MLLSVGYFVLTIITALLLISLGFVAINKSNKPRKIKQRHKAVLILGLTAWLTYNALMGYSAILATYELPPSFPIFLIFPIFGFTGYFIYKSKNANWLQHIKPAHLVYFQSFRIAVETLFIFSISAGVLHPNVTIEGYNYDMIIGLSAPVIGLLVFQFNKLPLRTILYWNYLGLFILATVIFVFTSTTYFTSIYGEAERIMPLAFTQTPYVFVAGFLMPAAVFIHLLSIIQINQILKQNK